MLKVLVVLSILLYVSDVCGQFGKNKVNWEPLNWQQLKSRHFTVIFESNIKPIAVEAATIAENSYDKFSQLFGHQIKESIPIILYSSNYKFQQTNIVIDFLEGVAGFAELFKYRIVLPFNGSYKDLYQTLKHELAHIFCYDILYRRPLSSIEFGIRPPDWLMEGLAQYLSLGQELTPIGKALLVDAVFDNKLSPISALNDFSHIPNVYFAYVQSHSFICWLSEQYGIKKIIKLVYAIRNKYRFGEVINKIFAASLDELSTRWQASLKKIYYPQIQTKEVLGELCGAKHITHGRYFFLSPGGDILAVVDDEFGMPQIKFVSTEGKEIKTITRGLANKEYEYISYAYPMVGFNKGGDKLAFVAKYKNKDAIFIFDILLSRYVNKVVIDEVDSILGFCYITDEKILISGIKDGNCSLYIVDIENNTVAQFSNPNLFSMDIYPVYLDGDNVAFVRNNTVSGTSSVILSNITTSQEMPLITLNCTIENLTNAGNYLLFACDMHEGVYQIYKIDLSDGTVARLTNYLCGAHLAYLYNEKLIFSGLSSGEFKIYSSTFTQVLLNISTPKSISTYTLTTKTYTTSRYLPKLSIDYSWGYLTYSTEVGIVSEVEVAASDMLGDNRVILRTLPYQQNFSNFYFIYQYLPKRTDIFCGVFNVTDAYLPERDAGIFFAAQYPIDKFRRIEYANFLAKKKYLRANGEELINEHSVSYVLDRGVWRGGWYVSGQRLRVTVDYAPKLTKKYSTFQNFTADIRMYKTVRDITYAFQILPIKMSLGEDKRTFYMGGVGFLPDYESVVVPLRGFRYAQFKGNIISKAVFEIRFPLIKSINFSFPLRLRNINSVVFIECAGVWPGKAEWGGAIGSGLRLHMLLPLRIDFAYKYHASKFSKKPAWHFSLGYDF